MPKSKSRNVDEYCKQCILCEKVGQFHENDIGKLLDNVTKWSINNSTQFKRIKKFECLVCYFKTNIFYDWKCHIMSLYHLSKCHRIEKVYSYVCCNKECKVILYGTEESLMNHTQKHTRKQDNTICLYGIPILMVEVMKRFGIEQDPLYYCSHCQKFASSSIHTENEKVLLKSLKCPIKIYCKFCKVFFLSSPEMIDVHSLSVEHLTLKCFDELCSIVRTNSKKIKLSEPKLDKQSDPSKQDDLQPFINLCADKSIKLPMIVFNRFEKVSLYDGKHKSCKCKSCNVSVNWDGSEIVSHLSKCCSGLDSTGSNKISINTFVCNVCNYYTNVFSNYQRHMVSYTHLSNCHETLNLYSYFCYECNIFMYSHEVGIAKHWKLHFNVIVSEIPVLFTFMAKVYKDFNINPNTVNIVHYYGKNESKQFSKLVSIVCHSCKIEFHSSVNDYDMHEMTSEHIILKFLSTKISVTNKNSLGNSLTIKSQTVITNSVVNKSIQDVPLLQNNDHSEITDDEHLKTSHVNNSQSILDKNYTGLFENVEKDQKMSAINDSMKEFEYKTDLSSKKKLKPYHTGKPQYKEYFIYKMEHLNFFCQYKDRIVKTLSYYCDFCDLMVEDKDIWDNHNQMKHPDCNELIIYCSTCSMFIIGPNSKEHSNTIEHSILLKLLDLFQQTKNLVTQNTEVLSSIFNDTSINQETNEEFELSIREISKEVLEFQCGDNNGSKNNDGILHTVKDNGKDNPDKMSMSNCDQNYTEKFKNEDVPMKNNSLLNFPSAMPHCSKDLTIQNKCNSEDVSTPTEDLIFNDLMFNPVTKEAILEDNMMDNVPKNEVSSAIVSPCSSQLNVTSLQKHENTVKFDEDNAYGEYVTQRLKQIENSNVKNDIKLEIDNIFYIKLKQSTL